MTTPTKPAQPCDAELWVMAGKYPAIPAQLFIEVARDVLNKFGAGQDAARAEPVVTLTGAQLLQALDLIAPDRDTDPTQLECELRIAYGDGYAGKGYYGYFADCPDEGSILLDAEAPDAPVSADPVAEITGMDEYGPLLGWHKHWANFRTGTKFYTAPVAAQATTRPTVTLGMIARAEDVLNRAQGASFRLHIKDALEAALDVAQKDGQFAARAQPALPSLPERKAAIEEVVRTCNRIPGANTWNAAELMYDLLTAQALQDLQAIMNTENE